MADCVSSERLKAAVLHAGQVLYQHMEKDTRCVPFMGVPAISQSSQAGSGNLSPRAPVRTDAHRSALGASFAENRRRRHPVLAAISLTHGSRGGTGSLASNSGISRKLST